MLGFAAHEIPILLFLEEATFWNLYLFMYIYIYISEVGVVISSLDHPLTGKSISIALAFALRACVRAKLRGRQMLLVWLGVTGVEFVGVVWPAGPPSGIFRSSQSGSKSTHLF